MEKNLVKDTATTKTIETLNKSIDKNSHIRSFTMTTMVMAGTSRPADFSAESKNNFSSTQNHSTISPFKPMS